MEPVETRINCAFIMSEILRNSQIHLEMNRNETAIESQMTTANLRFHWQFCVQNRVVLTIQKNPERPRAGLTPQQINTEDPILSIM